MQESCITIYKLSYIIIAIISTHAQLIGQKLNFRLLNSQLNGVKETSPTLSSSVACRKDLNLSILAIQTS